MTKLPKGTVTFLFTDIEGSTRLLEQLGERYAHVLADHHTLLRTAFRQRGGVEVETQGDALFVAFPSAGNAAMAAVEAQRAIAAHLWPEGVALRVRMGLHSGEATRAHTGYVGIDVHRTARICAVAHGGQILLSAATRALVSDSLDRYLALRDLGIHRLKDLTGPIHLFQLVAEGLQGDFPPLRSVDIQPHNLPAQLTSFVGRERERAEVRRLLGSTRLITLTGPGGMGKTRLAIQVGAESSEDFADGVWFADLAPLGNPALVPQAVASPLGVREAAGRPLLEALTDYLQARRLLLLLDNCEHVAPACADLAVHLLRSSPGLRILATSRQSLDVSGEMTWRVPPMSYPEANGQAEPDPMGFDAVRLFVERAQLVQPGFGMSDHSAPVLFDIIRRLEGLPLPIELAAARLRILSLEEILDRLNDRFRLLATTLRGIPARQLTERATIDWSFNLLTAPEQRLFTRAAVFRGGFTLEAAEAVCAREDGDGEGALDLLSNLVDKSMVMVGDSAVDPARYRLLEPLREYGWYRLASAGDTATYQTAHAGYFTDLAERAAPELTGAAQSSWLDRLDAERHNLRAAIDWWIGEQNPNSAMRLAVALTQFWFVRGYFTEGRSRIADILNLPTLETALTRARGIGAAAKLAWGQGDLPEARELHAEALVMFRSAGDKKGAAFSLNGLALVARGQGDPQQARRLYEEALAINRELDDRPAIAMNLQNIGILLIGQGDYASARSSFHEKLRIERDLQNTYGIALALHGLGTVATDEGDYGSARTFHEESLALRREMGDKTGIAVSLMDLGMLAALQGDFGAARRLQEEALALSREVGNRVGVMRVLADLAETALKQGDLATAQSSLRESLETAQNLGVPGGVARALEGLAILAGEEGQPDRALRLAGAAAALREGHEIQQPPATAAEHAPALDQARAALGEGAGDAAWTEGRRMTPQEAVAYALTLTTSASAPVTSRS